eukprot:394560_1
MEALMKEIADAEESSISGSGSVVIRDGDDDDIKTDDDKQMNNNKVNKPVGVIGVHRILSHNSAGSNDNLSHSNRDEDDQFEQNSPGNVAMEALMKEIADAEENSRSRSGSVVIRDEDSISSYSDHFDVVAMQHTQTNDDADGNNGLNKMWSHFVQFTESMDRPIDAPLAFNVPDKTSSYVELRDMLQALPTKLSNTILREQQTNPTDNIKDIILQRGCWPMISYADNRIQTINTVWSFDDVLTKLERYLKPEKNKSNVLQKMNKPGFQLLRSLDAENTTGFRLHQITATVRKRNESKHGITSLNLRVGRLWNMDISIKHNLISDSMDFFLSLHTPSTMLLLGPNSAKKAALCREICKQLSVPPINMRTALVDTRTTVAGFAAAPIEIGQTCRFAVNNILNQYRKIDETRLIYPQVVVVDEVVTSDDIESIGVLQSEGISVVVGTNMRSLEALLAHPLYSQLLPPQNRLPPSNQYSSMSPHLLILEISNSCNDVKMYKNIPAAIKAITRFSQPECLLYPLKWKNIADKIEKQQQEMKYPVEQLEPSKSMNETQTQTIDDRDYDMLVKMDQKQLYNALLPQQFLFDSLMKIYSNETQSYIDVAAILTEHHLYFVSAQNYQIWQEFQFRTKIEQLVKDNQGIDKE